MIPNQVISPDSSTSYNISVESFEEIDSIKQSCKSIEDFIENHKEKFKKSNIFRTLVALHDLFKIEISRGIQLRQVLIAERNNNSKLHTELREFYELIKKQSGKGINTIAEAKSYIAQYFREIDEFKAEKELEIASFSSKIDIIMGENAKYETNFTLLQKQIEKLKNNQTQMVTSNQYEQIVKEKNDLVLEKQKLLNDLEILKNQQKEKSDSAVQNLKLEIAKEKHKNQYLTEKNLELNEHLQNLAQKSANFENSYIPTLQKLQTELIAKESDMMRLKEQLNVQEIETNKKVEQLTKENSILISSIKKNNNKVYIGVIHDICKILNIPLNTQPEELPSIIKNLVQDNSTMFEIYNNNDDKYAIGIRPLILVVLTCNRLLRLRNNQSLGLFSEIDMLKHELENARNHIEFSEI